MPVPWLGFKIYEDVKNAQVDMADESAVYNHLQSRYDMLNLSFSRDALGYLRSGLMWPTEVYGGLEAIQIYMIEARRFLGSAKLKDADTQRAMVKILLVKLRYYFYFPYNYFREDSWRDFNFARL